MRWGVCGDIELAKAARAAGYDYWEPSVANLLLPLEDESAFRRRLDAARAVELPIEAVNYFIPGDLKIVGPAADPAALRAFVEIAMARAARAGVRIVVFGSGAARKRLDDWDEQRAWGQIVEFAAMAARLAAGAGVTIAIEPLNAKETNTLNTVALGARLAREVNLPALRLMVDSYHWEQESGGPGALEAGRGLFVHAHAATLPGRLVPGGEDYDFKPFLAALAGVGYDARLSIEGRVDNPEQTLPTALALLKQAAAG